MPKRSGRSNNRTAAPAARPAGEAGDPAAVGGAGNAATTTILAERFKTKMCKNFATRGMCPYESRCMFAHGDHELRTKAQNIADDLVTEEAIKAFQKARQIAARSAERKRERQARRAAAAAAAAAEAEAGPMVAILPGTHHPGMQRLEANGRYTPPLQRLKEFASLDGTGGAGGGDSDPRLCETRSSFGGTINNSLTDRHFIPSGTQSPEASTRQHEHQQQNQSNPPSAAAVLYGEDFRKQMAAAHGLTQLSIFSALARTADKMTAAFGARAFGGATAASGFEGGPQYLEREPGRSCLYDPCASPTWHPNAVMDQDVKPVAAGVPVV